VTALTNLGRSTIYQEIAAGRLRAIKIGRSVRVRRDDLDAWLDRHTTATTGIAE
jgi:excisionase family DNA binding protein